MLQVRSRHLLLALLALALCLSPAAFVSAADKEKKESEDTELAKHMEVIEKAMKKLKKSLKSADENAASATTVAEMKKASEACVELIPAYAAKVPEAKRAEFVESYKKEMKEFIVEVDKLADAVKAGKNEEALTIHKKLGELEDKGHEKFTPEN